MKSEKGGGQKKEKEKVILFRNFSGYGCENTSLLQLVYSQVLATQIIDSAMSTHHEWLAISHEVASNISLNLSHLNPYGRFLELNEEG